NVLKQFKDIFWKFVLVTLIFFIIGKRNSLRYKIHISSGFTVIVWPSVHMRYFTRPVTMKVLYRSSPLQSVGLPWILWSTWPPEDAVEYVKEEQQLRSCTNNCKDTDQLIDVHHSVEHWKFSIGIIPSGYTCQ